MSDYCNFQLKETGEIIKGKIIQESNEEIIIEREELLIGIYKKINITNLGYMKVANEKK